MRERLGYLVLSLVIALAVSASYLGGLFTGLERFLEDRLFLEKPLRSDIVLVAIDDASLAKLGQWPWPRAYFAEFLNSIEDAGVRSVGFDVIFSEPSRAGEADDAELEQALLEFPHPVILPLEPVGQDVIRPLNRFSRHAELGHIAVTADPDGVVRTLPFTVAGTAPLSYRLAETAGFELAPRETFDDRTRIVYAQPPGSFRTISFHRFLEEDLDLAVRDTMLLVGATAADLHDTRSVPLSGGTQMAGVEIHANAATMFIEGYRLTNLPAAAVLAWIVLAAFLPILAILYMSRLSSLFLANVALGACYLAAHVFLFSAGYAANLIHIHGAWILSAVSLMGYQYFVIDRNRAQIKKLFSKYVSDKVLSELLKHPDRVVLGGEEREITVLFSDIRGFTTLSENTTPTELVSIINRYFNAMTSEILHHDGVVDKYIGDAIMAFWGAPLDDAKQAEKAVSAALAMRERLSAFNEELKAEKGLEIAIGVGLYTGPAVVGNMGSSERFDYTAMGDTVNTASRLEGITKTYGVHCIIGETTRSWIESHQEFVTRELDQIQVKGKQDATKIYEPLVRAQVSGAKQNQLKLFEKGRDAYYAGEWDSAITTFMKVLEFGPDGPSEELLRRAQELKADPPTLWNGVYAFTKK